MRKQIDQLKLLTMAIALISLLQVTSYAATLKITGKNSCTIELDGEIDQFTDADLASRYKSLGNGHPEQCRPLPSLYLNSNGGDVEAAIRAGLFIREKYFSTNIMPDQSCASACVLLFLGGVNRSCVGNIGLHRPFSEKLSETESDARRSYEKINRKIGEYLNQMNIPDDILSVMNSIPPGEIKWIAPLSDGYSQQLQALHINGVDPVFADQRDSAAAKRLGISKQEFYARQQKAEVLCPAPSFEDMRGKSIAEMRAIFDRANNCRRDVMNGREPPLDDKTKEELKRFFNAR